MMFEECKGFLFVHSSSFQVMLVQMLVHDVGALQPAHQVPHVDSQEPHKMTVQLGLFNLTTGLPSSFTDKHKVCMIFHFGLLRNVTME
jgi:hypothetical protein